MAKKSKSKRGKKNKKNKKNKQKKLWCTEDLNFDKDGNLCIMNEELSKALAKAIYKADRRFCIRIHCTTDSDQPGVADSLDRKSKKSGDTTTVAVSDDGGRPPVNAMCPC